MRFLNRAITHSESGTQNCLEGVAKKEQIFKMRFQLLPLLVGYAFRAAQAEGTEELTHAKRQAPTPVASACTTFQTPTIPGATVVQIQAARRQGVVVNTTLMGDNGSQRVPPLDICDVNVTLSHGTSGDRVRVEVCRSSLS